MIFESFFIEYRKGIGCNSLKVNWKKAEPARKWLLSIATLLVAACLVSAVLKQIQVTVILLLVVFLMALVFGGYERWYSKSHHKERCEAHIKEKIEPLIKLLEEKSYNNPAKIDWMISCCEATLEQQKKRFLPNWGGIGDVLFAVILVIFGVFLDKQAPDIIDTMFWGSLRFAAIVAIVAIYVFLIRDGVQSPRRNALTSLKNELEYIKSELKGEQSGTSIQEVIEATEMQEQVAMF